MNITDKKITARATAARIEEAKAEKASVFCFALIIIALATYLNAI